MKHDNNLTFIRFISGTRFKKDTVGGQNYIKHTLKQKPVTKKDKMKNRTLASTLSSIWAMGCQQDPLCME